MSIADELRRRGFRPEQIAGATVNGKPLVESEKKPKTDDGMNKLERRYSWFLSDLVASGHAIRYYFGKVKLRLADRTWYTVDFQVWLPDGSIWMVETKGWCRDDAAVKFKVAREMYSEYHWMMIGHPAGGAWTKIMGESIAILIPNGGTNHDC